MAWTANCTVTSVSDTGIVASGPATGTDDDTSVTDVSVTVNGVSHLAVGAVITVEANC
jgi:hypothetical protein